MLSGGTRLEDTYVLTDIPSTNGLLLVKVEPIDVESMFQTVILAFNKNSLQHMLIRDGFEQDMRLEFTQVSKNLVLTNDFFVFIPPKGVDVLGDSGL